MQSILMFSLRQILEKQSRVILVALPVAFMMSGCAYKAPGNTTLNDVSEDRFSNQELPTVVLKTSMGDILIDLYPEKAPATVANFLQYAGNGFYDGTIFHRVIRDFMIQGGGFTPDMTQKPTGAPIENEAANGLKNSRGTLAMARTSDPNSATAQFFINVVNNHALDYRSPDANGIGYCVFGKVVSGLDVVDAITKVPTGKRGPHQNVPVEPVVIDWVIISNAQIRETGLAPMIFPQSLYQF